MTMVQNEIFLPGEWTSGKEVRDQNVNAAVSLANIVKTTLGPNGLDKMMVDEIGEITITNDGATILQKLDVMHPAAKVLVELSALQDREVGDGTTSVVIIAAELLKNANELIDRNMHSTTVMSGYQLALKKAINFIEQRLSVQVSTLSVDHLHQIAKTSMSSKIIGLQAPYFAEMVVNAIQAVKTVQDNGEVKYPVRAVSVIKALGGSVRESYLIPGYALMAQRASMQMPMLVDNAKIALLDFNLQQKMFGMGTQIVIKDAEKLEGVRDMEFEISRKHIELIVKTGANVILTTGGIDDMAQKYLVDAGILGVRRVTMEDLKKIGKLVSGKIVTSMADMEGNESFDSSNLGVAAQIYEERIGEDHFILIKNGTGRQAGSIMVRGPNTQMIGEVERSVHDALCAVSRTLESQAVVPGGGCVETALNCYLEEFAKTIPGKEQLAVTAFAKALLAIPKQLALNSALDATDLVAKLRAAHATSQRKDSTQETKDNLRHFGLDLKTGIAKNNLLGGVLEPVCSKVKSLSFATEAAITILRIDDNIVLNPETQQQ